MRSRRGDSGRRVAAARGHGVALRTFSGADVHSGTMNDDRHAPGMPVLHRQPSRTPVLPPSMQGLPARSVPETRPTPLQAHYINLSVVSLICGFIAISALELGSGFSSPVVKLCLLIGGPILIVTTADAGLRIWRSAWAWMPVNRGRGLFRLAWVIMTAVLIALAAAAIALAVVA